VEAKATAGTSGSAGSTSSGCGGSYYHAEQQRCGVCGGPFAQLRCCGWPCASGAGITCATRRTVGTLHPFFRQLAVNCCRAGFGIERVQRSCGFLNRRRRGQFRKRSSGKRETAVAITLR